MKKRSTLVLMELAIMLSVFALAAALCLRAFSLAEGISEASALTDEAHFLAQSAAEVIKAARGDLAAAAEILNADFDGESLTKHSENLKLSANLLPSDLELLGKAEVTVTDEQGNILCTLPAAWQKEGGQ